MNLIEQLKLTPKWGEFEKWWDTEYTDILYIDRIECSYDLYVEFNIWCDFPFEFQYGVFKKFILKGIDFEIRKIERGKILCCQYNENEVSFKEFETFEELILWYFNN